jgi:hypothetical protein
MLYYWFGNHYVKPIHLHQAHPLRYPTSDSHRRHQNQMDLLTDSLSLMQVLLVEETGVPGENLRPVTSHWQTLSHAVVLSSTSVLQRVHDFSDDGYWQVVINPTYLDSHVMLCDIVNCYHSFILTIITDYPHVLIKLGLLSNIQNFRLSALSNKTLR